jgi:hypothetical protein
MFIRYTTIKSRETGEAWSICRLDQSVRTAAGVCQLTG